MVYQRGPDDMSASKAEQEWAPFTRSAAAPLANFPIGIAGQDGHVKAVRFADQAMVNGQLQPTGRELTFEADMVFLALSTRRCRARCWRRPAMALTGGRIATDEEAGLTSLPGVWAGAGDCRAGGQGLTVEAVEHVKAHGPCPPFFPCNHRPARPAKHGAPMSRDRPISLRGASPWQSMQPSVASLCSQWRRSVT